MDHQTPEHVAPVASKGLTLQGIKPQARPLNEYEPYWAECYGRASFLPTTRAEMDALGWDSCDVIVVTGDAYVDHPSFGMAIVGRLLEAHGFRVGIIDQPGWQDCSAFEALGAPNLFFGVTAGNMDSMINRYTADRKVRRDDAYSPDDIGGQRPDRASIVYAQRCREAFSDVPIVIGGIEASLRRIAHYDYWQDKVRRSILADAKADMLIYGNGERAIVDISHRLARGDAINEIRDLRGTAFFVDDLPSDWTVIDSTRVDKPGRVETPVDVVTHDPVLYAHANRVLHLETNPGNARALVQNQGGRKLWLNPPPVPLTTEEMDYVFGQPFARVPHPKYDGRKLPAYEMIRFSVNIMRGCFGGCTFCSITEHEGRQIQSRSEESIINEIEAIRDEVPGFTGVISDLGGPTANMYRLACKSTEIEKNCRLPSCVYPDICKNLNTDHSSLIKLYKRARELPGVKKVLIASGLRYDLAITSPEYVEELVTHHVGSAKAGKKQYLIPYFIAAHPGTTEEDMMNLALWLKTNGFKADQVQTFYPSPMATATAMYNGKHQLIPTHQPRPGAAKKTSGSATTRRRGPGRQPREGQILTQHTGLPPREGTEAGRKNRSRPAGSSAQRRKTRQSS